MLQGNSVKNKQGPDQPGSFPWLQIIGMGTTALRPPAASVNAGWLYYDTTLDIIYRSNGVTWDLYCYFPAFVKLLGRPNGQIIYGGTGSGDSLTLNSTFHSTKGNVQVMDNLYMFAGWIAEGSVTPAQITSNQNNYAPSGAGAKLMLNLSTDASRDITGLLIGASNADGQIVIIRNIGANDIVLKNQDANSTASNRFAFGGDVTIATLKCAILQYYGAQDRWMLLAGPSSGGFTAATQAEQETGTSTTVGVTPGRQQYHQSAAKMWVSFNGTGTPAVNGSYNLDSGSPIVDQNVGYWSINFDVDFSNTDYCVSGCARRNTSGTTSCAIVNIRSQTSMKLTSAVHVTANSVTPAAVDCEDVMVAGWGDQ